MAEWNVQKMDEMIRQMRTLSEELRQKAGGIQAIERNLDRISASIKMLELNVSDVKELL